MSLSPVDALAAGYAVIVPNNRSQQEWGARFISNQPGSVLPTQYLQSFSEFIRTIYQKEPLFIHSQLITDEQAMVLFATQLPKEIPQTSIQSLTCSFIEAYKLLIRWNLSRQELGHFLQNDQQKFFHHYYPIFQTLLNKRKLLMLDDALVALIDNSTINWSKNRYYFYGFDDFYPLQQSLLKKIKDATEVLIEPTVEKKSDHVIKKIYETADEEFEAALEWLMCQPKNRRAAIVVLEMNKDFQTITEKIIRKVTPALTALPLEEPIVSISLSSGVPMSDTQLIQEILNLLSTKHNNQCNFFIDGSLFLKNFFLNENTHLNISSWNNLLLKSLIDSQWCLNHVLTSTEYQIRYVFLKKLDEFSSCGSFLDECVYNKWVELLTLFCQNITFQAQSKNDDHSCMGLLEAAPLAIESIWMVGADYKRLPQSLSPHPFLPPEIQEIHSLPHAHPKRELTYLTKTLSRLSQAEEFIISYAIIDNQQQSRSSSLIDKLFPGPYNYERVEKDRSAHYQWSLDRVTRVLERKHERLSVAQLNNFAQCPFKGFSKLLKGVDETIVTKLPLDPSKQGQLLHQYIQDRLGGYQGDQAFKRYTSHWPDLLIDSEKERIELLYYDIYEQMKFRIGGLSFEHKISFYVDQWLIEGRVDIWDAQERHVYDIKSKNFYPSAWFSQEPTDFQGALYAIGLDALHLGLIRLVPNSVIIQSQSVDGYLESWIQQLQDSLKKWGSGNFDPQPNTTGLCHHCRLKKACRYEYT